MKLAESMGKDLDASAWAEILNSLEILEGDERGTAGHDRVVAYARGLIKPLATKLGWDTKPGETPDVMDLRHRVLVNLGAWGDRATITEAHRRFAALLIDRKSVAADDERTLLAIVATNADGATFAQLHALARSAKDETELSRYYFALMRVRDPGLARQALAIALSDEVPPQLRGQRIWLVSVVQRYHPQLAWRAFTSNVDMLIKPLSQRANLTLVQDVPEIYWNAVPLSDLHQWLSAHLPAELAPDLSRGMETAAFYVDQRAALVPAADAYIATTGLR